jgi:hypothetical protein
MRIRALTTILTTCALLASSFAAQAKSKDQADAEELQNYRLSLPVVKKLAQVQENIYSSLKANPSLADKYKDKEDHDASNESLDQTVKKIEKIPELKQAIVKAGLTPREYFVASLAMAQATMASAMAEAPDSLPSGLRANMAFVKSHQAELTKMQKRAEEIERETKKATGQEKKQVPGDDQPSDDEGKQ